MLLVDSFAQNYRWTMSYTLSLTMPQIIMLSHGADVNKKRMDKRLNTTRSAGSTPTQSPSDIAYHGKSLTQLTSEEYLEYHRAV